MSKRIEKLVAKIRATRCQVSRDELTGISTVKVCVRGLPDAVAYTLTQEIHAAVERAADAVAEIGAGK